VINCHLVSRAAVAGFMPVNTDSKGVTPCPDCGSELISDGVGFPSALGQLLIVATAVLATTITITKR